MIGTIALLTTLPEEDDCTLMKIENILINISQHLLHVLIGSRQVINPGEDWKRVSYLPISV